MFKIGEFSKIAQVAVSQLRYYDEIGLLKPAKIDAMTGYRYYQAQQLPHLNRILALKELGLSLDQIARMLDDNISTEEIRGMFALKRAQVEQAVQDELIRLRAIDARLRQLEAENTSSDYDIVVKSVPAQPFLAFRAHYPTVEAAMMMYLEIQHVLPPVVGEKNVGHFTVLMHNEGFTLTDLDLEMGYALQRDYDGAIQLPAGPTMTASILPAVDTMVTAVHVGPLELVMSCRTALALWAEANNCIFGQGREMFIVPPVPGKEDETVLEVQYPVFKQAGTDLLPA